MNKVHRIYWQFSYQYTETKATIMEPTWVYTRSYAYILWLFRMCLWWNSLEWEWGMGSLTFFIDLVTLFLFTVLSQSALIWRFVPCLIASFYSVFCWYDWEDCSFLKGKVDAREREVGGLRGLEGGETGFGVSCVREK